MKRQFLTLLLLLISSTWIHTLADERVDSLLQVLDQAIAEADIYVERKENRIAELKHRSELLPALSGERFEINNDIFLEYKAYSSDSALRYLNENIALARQLGNREIEIRTRLYMADLLSSMGMHLEATDILDTIDRDTLPESLLGTYYSSHEHAYAEAGTASPRFHMFTSQHLAKRRAYRDSMDMAMDHSSASYLKMKEIRLRDEKRYDEALAVNDRRLAEATPGTTQYALVTYNRYQLLRNMGRPKDEQLNYLIRSAIADVHAADREQSSIMMLAEEMNKLGDIKRANAYINLSWNLSQSYRTRMRTWTNIGPMSLINNSYQEAITRHNRELRTMIICVAVLAALLVIALICTYRLLRINAVARQRLQEANTKLIALNEDYEKVNRELHTANLELSESNLIKEVYVARFFKLCSVYVNRLQKYRKQIHNKLQRGQTADLLKITGSGNAIDDIEVRELYENFDAAFLHIFPNFVEAVNAMLIPEERIELKPGEKLNTELRILALIRLGITDSSQIAELLHYSVNTIYNYRSRIKSKASVNRDDFEEMIAGIR